MLLKASTPALSLLHAHSPVITAAFSASFPSSSTSSTSRRCCLHSRNTQSHGIARRYATASRPGPFRSHKASETSPPSWPSTPHPTPYDILAIPRQGPYTKKRFYQLVKLYHPDIYTHTAHANSRASAGSQAISPALRLERYHLIVAANDILSDPNKRHLYDTYGTGWTFPPASDELRARDRSWRDRPGNAAMNATWEDWERWHAAKEGRTSAKKGPGGFYMPNAVFAALVALMCTIGALAQGRRAEIAGAHYMDVTAQNHQVVSEVVMRSASASRGMSQEERVARFLRDRENLAYQYDPGRYEEYREWKAVDEQQNPSTRYK